MQDYSVDHVKAAVAQLLRRFENHTFSPGAITAWLDKFKMGLVDAYQENGFAEQAAHKMANDARKMAAKKLLFRH